MASFAHERRFQPQAGYQRHHLIPVEIIRHPAFAKIFAAVSSVGFDPHDFASNGVCLPACEEVAIHSGLPLHRGPHPHYTRLVSEQVDCLGRDVSGPMALMIGLSQLQGSLRRSLDGSNSILWLNRRDPRHISSRLIAFDDDLRRLSMADLLG